MSKLKKTKTVSTSFLTLKSLGLRYFKKKTYLVVSKLLKNLNNALDGTVSTYFWNYYQFFKTDEVERWAKYD